MKKKKTKADSVTVRISREARKKLHIASASMEMTFIDYIDFLAEHIKIK